MTRLAVVGCALLAVTNAQKEKKRIKELEAELDACKSSCGAGAGADAMISTAYVKEWVSQMYHLQVAVGTKAYKTFVPAAARNALETAPTQAWTAGERGYKQAKLLSTDLWNAHVAEHYNKHAAKHVDLAWKTYEKQGKPVLNQGFDAANKAYGVVKDKLYMVFYTIPEQIYAVAKPAVDGFVKQYPQHKAHIPTNGPDFCLFAAAALSAFLFTAYVAIRVVKFNLGLIFSVVGFFWGLFWAIVCCPFCCCRKRKVQEVAGKKGKSFGKVPVKQEQKTNGKAAAKKK